MTDSTQAFRETRVSQSVIKAAVFERCDLIIAFAKEIKRDLNGSGLNRHRFTDESHPERKFEEVEAIYEANETLRRLILAYSDTANSGGELIVRTRGK